MLRSFAEGRIFGGSYGGSPAWVLALHGWRRSHGDFAAVLDGPGGPLDAIAPDLPGFGASPPPPEPWGSAQYAQALIPVLSEMAPGVVVLGHSFGGRVALNLAALEPERVSALVLTGVPLLRRAAPRRPPLRFRAVRRLAATGMIDEARLEAARRRRGSADYRAAEGVMRQVLVRTVAEDYAELLATTRCPVELVWGADDTEAPLVVAERALTMLPDATLTVVPGGGHLTPLDGVAQLRAALERHRPEPGRPAGAR